MIEGESQAGALSFRDFRFFLAMRLPTSLAVQMQSVAVGWQVYDISHKPLSLGLVGLAQFLPVFGFALVAGHVADRFDRRRILMACIGLQLLCALLLLAIMVGGTRDVRPIYAVLVLFGTARAFSAPAIQSILLRAPERGQQATVNAGPA